MAQIKCPTCGQPCDFRMAICRKKDCRKPTGVTINMDCCCEHPNFQSYTLYHDPQPILLTESLAESIESLLWYLPNTKCLQAKRNDFVTAPAYSDKLFYYLLEKMGMTDDDILWYPTQFMPEDVHWSESKVCVNCQKLILQMDASNTKTENLFRHIRNIIAHGRFNLVNGMLIGSDMDSNGITALIKIWPEKLVSAIKSFTDPELKENIIRDIFLKLGYEVGQETAFRIGNGRSSLKFDLLVKKAHRTYAVEIKRFGGKRYLHPEALEPFVNAVDTLLETSAKPVLVTDREVLTNAAQE